jgi:hypothetical protein
MLQLWSSVVFALYTGKRIVLNNDDTIETCDRTQHSVGHVA